MLQYLRWMWKEAPRALRVEFLVTIFAIEVLALITMLVLTRPADMPPPLSNDAARSMIDEP